MMRTCSRASSRGQITGGGGDASFFIVPSRCLLIVPILRPASGPLGRTLDREASDIRSSGSSTATRVITPAQ